MVIEQEENEKERKRKEEEEGLCKKISLKQTEFLN